VPLHGHLKGIAAGLSAVQAHTDVDASSGW
jgi:hypothetical protein